MNNDETMTGETTPETGFLPPEQQAEIPADLLLTERQRRSRLIERKRRTDSTRDTIFEKHNRLHQDAVDVAAEQHPDIASDLERAADDADPARARTVDVDGEQLTEAELIARARQAQGIEDLQGREAALNEWASKLQRYGEQLQTPQPGAGIDPETLRARVRESQEALLRGDDALSSEILAEVFTSVTQQPQARRAAPSPADAWSREQRAAVNDAFNREFADLSDEAFGDAQALATARLNKPDAIGKSPEQFAREIGAAVRRAQGGAAPAEQPQRTLRASIPLTRPPTPRRSIAPDASPARHQSASSYVAQLRRNRGNDGFTEKHPDPRSRFHEGSRR